MRNEQPALANVRIQSSTYGQAIPWVIAGTGRVAGNLLWYGNFKAIRHSETQGGGKGGGGSMESISYTYEAAVIVGLARGPVQDIGRVWRGKEQLATLADAGLSVSRGQLGQAAWSWLQSYAPSDALGYSGLANVYSQSYPLDSAASLANHNFEVVMPGIGAVPGVAEPVVDGCPRVIVETLLTDVRSGSGFPSERLLGLSKYEAYCRAAGLWMSPVLGDRKAAVDWLKHFLLLTNTKAAWTGSALEFVPLGDTDIDAHGASYVADRTPDFDLTPDHFCPESGDPLVRVRRHQGLAREADTATADDVGYNVVTLEIENRAQEYAVQPISRDDLAHIEQFGRRPKSSIKAPEIKDPAIAAQIAQQLVQDELAKRNRYEFVLDWHFCRLRPLRIVTLTEPSLDLDRTPVRILSVEELDDERVSVVAEDAPIGIATAPRYGIQAGSGFSHNYAVAPGSVSDAVIFEAPAQLAGNTGLEVYVAARSPGPNWGGCRVWVSLDGDNYREIARVDGGARVGTLAGPISSGNLSLGSVSGQLISASAADAAALSTLSVVLDGQPEFLAFASAQLIAPGAYTLSGLVRGVYGTPITAHSPGARFVRIDSAIAKSGALDVSFIGKAIKFKFTSFNVFGVAEETLADVSPVSYDVTGFFAKTVPGIAGKALALTADSLTVKVSKTGTLTPASITLTAARKGLLSGAVQWSIVSGTATLAGTGDVRTLDPLGMLTDAVTVRASVVDAVGTYSQDVTIQKVREGADGAAGAQGPAGAAGAAGPKGESGNTSLINSSSWVVGSNGSQPGYNQNGQTDENRIALTSAPDGTDRPIWVSGEIGATAGDWDGGWNTDWFAINEASQYRFSVWIRCLGSMSGQYYLGVGQYSVNDLQGGVNGNPYFVQAPRSPLVSGRWYLAVGYVFPSSHGGPQLQQSGLYDGETGAKVASGVDFRWRAGQTNTCHRAYQYYASAGARQDFWGPRVDLCNGLEPSLAELLSVASARSINAVLDNEAAVFPADSSGAVTSYVGASCTMSVLLGGLDDSANWSYTRLAGPGVTISGSGRTVNVDSLAAGQGSSYVDITATRSGFASLTKRFSVSKSKSGVNGANGSQGPQGPAGANGANGAAGARGATRASRPVGSAGWSDSEANAALTSMGYAVGTNFDEVTLYMVSGAWAQTRYYYGGSWLTQSAVVDGNLLVRGSVGALALNVNQLSAITANVGFLTSRAGSPGAYTGAGYEQDNGGYRVFNGVNAMTVKIAP